MNITESIKFDKVKEENEILKKELAEKDKEIIELKHQQLYKEDFEEYEEIESCGCGNKCDENVYLYACGDQITVSNFRLKDNSNYDKLPSKEDKNMYLVIKDSDNIKDHYKITDLISKNTDHEEKENFWYKFGLEQYWTEYCWSSGTIDNIKDIDEYLAKKFKELQEKPWNEIIEKYVEDKFGYTVANNLSDINWEKQSDKNIEPVR